MDIWEVWIIDQDISTPISVVGDNKTAYPTKCDPCRPKPPDMISDNPNMTFFKKR